MSLRKNSDASVFTSIQAWCKEWALLKTPPRRDAGLQFQQRLVLAGSWVKTILNACSPTCLRFAGGSQRTWLPGVGKPGSGKIAEKAA